MHALYFKVFFKQIEGLDILHFKGILQEDFNIFFLLTLIYAAVGLCDTHSLNGIFS